MQYRATAIDNVPFTKFRSAETLGCEDLRLNFIEKSNIHKMLFAKTKMFLYEIE